MKNLTLRNITKACHGEYRGPENLLDKEVAGVTIDSRKVEKTICSLPLTVNASTLTNSFRIPLKKAQCA